MLLCTQMEPWLNLIEETITHFREGARIVKAYNNDVTYIITRAKEDDQYWITIEESNFQKTKTSSLDHYFKEVFGIEAIY